MGGEIISMSNRREFWDYMKTHPYILLFATAKWCTAMQTYETIYCRSF